ncbi:glucose sorbosone dehydrogenase [Luteipulveratus mongoliensis]|uniref:Glucose sorbosone dehydrogenase n=1 Tax=Luteipulveratus mongoliensis TaxID=571913 RepID=A0A0K1JQH2_9MICO|nr:glucose sorbosone dehydrogenase [Luteipulveratus mongoliensis]
MLGAGAVTLATSAPAASSAARSRVTAIPQYFEFDKPDIVAEGLDYPWGLDFYPASTGTDATTALFNQRDTAEMFSVKAGGAVERIGSIPGVKSDGDGNETGLLGLAVAPTFNDDGLVYIYFTAEDDNRVGRVKLDSLEPEIILDGIPKAEHHNGGRLRFGPDGMLYVTTGDAMNGDNAQDIESLGGKILRINPDGSVPSDNPTSGSPVFTLGHRNVEGLDWTPGKDLYASELGEDTWDELNHIEAGKNYGWPDVEGPGDNPDYVDPIATWHTEDASPSGVSVHIDVVYVAALRGEQLWQVPLTDGGDPVAVLHGTYGRLRTVEEAPDGWLWVATANGGGGDSIIRFPALPAARRAV